MRNTDEANGENQGVIGGDNFVKYNDFELLATEPQIVKAEGKKRLTFKLFLPGVFPEPIAGEYDMREIDKLKQVAGQTDATWQQVADLGQALANALLPDPVQKALNERIIQAQTSGNGVRVRLMLSGSDLNNLPWEFSLFNRAGGEPKVTDFLALMPNVSLVRHAAAPLPAWTIEAKSPATIVVALASPSDWPQLKVAEELKVIERAVGQNPRLHILPSPAAKRGDLPNNAHRAHLFHFAGHGCIDMIPSYTPGAYEGNAKIVLVDEYGDPDELDADLLAVRLREAGVRVAVLGACLTAQRDDKNRWGSVAEALLKAELGAVVGMQFPVRDESAVLFAETFYAALVNGLAIDEAVSTGRVAVAAAGDARGWGTPVLYLRAPDGVVFPEYTADLSREPERSEMRIKAVQRIGVLEGIAVTVRIGHMCNGSVRGEQQVDVVKSGASAIGVEIGTLGRRC